MEAGCLFAELEPWEEMHVKQNLYLPMWKSLTSFGLMIEKKEKSALSLRVFGEDITPGKAVPKPIRPDPRNAEITAEPTAENVLDEDQDNEALDSVIPDEN